MSRQRITWAARLPEVVAEHGPATVAVAAGWVLGREPSRAELVAAHRAARRLVAAGHLAGGRTWASDATGRRVLAPCIAAPGTALPAGMSLGAVAADAGVSRSTVARIVRRQAAEVAVAHLRQSAALHHRQPWHRAGARCAPPWKVKALPWSLSPESTCQPAGRCRARRCRAPALPGRWRRAPMPSRRPGAPLPPAAGRRDGRRQVRRG